MKKNDLTRLLIVTFLIICLCPLYSSLSHGGTITDNFDGAALNDRLWWNYSTDQHQRCVQQGDELRIQIDGASVGEGWFNAGIISKFKLKGNFEIVVDYKLTNWPYSNGVGAGISCW